MNSGNSRRASPLIGFIIPALALSLVCLPSFAGPFRNWIIESHHEKADAAVEASSLPAGIRLLRDVAYGSDDAQRFDVYLPAHPERAPVIFMVHGGAWSLGDKAAKSVVENKVARWASRGFIVVSTNYRMLPAAAPVEEAKDVARALAKAQEMAASWGGDRGRFILMGHSAGAHLVALLNADTSLAAGISMTPWLGVVCLDSAAYDVEKKMRQTHPAFYDRAFGSDPDYWRRASPYGRLQGGGKPMLLVCSRLRRDSCGDAERFAALAESTGMRVSLLPEDLSHRELNLQLGEEGDYTFAVESFIQSLDEKASSLLNAPPPAAGNR